MTEVYRLIQRNADGGVTFVEGARTQTLSPPVTDTAMYAAGTAFFSPVVYTPPVDPASIGKLTQLFTLTGADMNTTADQQFKQVFQFTQWMPSFIVITNASASLTTAVGGIYLGAGKTGSIIVPAAQVYSGLVIPADVMNARLVPTGQQVFTSLTPFLSLTTAQGSAAVCDMFIMGIAGG